MERTEILMGMTFFSIFFISMLYNYMISMINAGALSESCPEFVAKFADLTGTNYDVGISSSTSPSSTNCISCSSNLANMCGLGLGHTNDMCKNIGGQYCWTCDVSCGCIGTVAQGGWFDSVTSFLSNIGKSIAAVGNAIGGFIGRVYGIMASFFLLLTTNCPLIAPIKVVMYVFFIPFVIGMSYILIRLLKSMIPTIGGD
jgi:hypothetical protein